MDNFATIEEANDFMTGKHFLENPIGTDFAPEELAEQLLRGVADKVIKTRIEIGPRGLPEGF